MLGAIEAGGTKIVCAVGKSPGHMLARHTIQTGDPADNFRDIKTFLDNQSALHGRLQSIGVAAFGPIDIDPASGTWGSVLGTPKARWAGASWHDTLAAFDCPLAIETDVGGAGLGEWLLGAGIGCRTLAYVTVGTGIGAAVLRDGKPMAGAGHFEMGHIYPPHDHAVDPFPGICRYHGNCLEGLASGPAIAARWTASLSDLPPEHPAHAIIANYLSHLAVMITLAHMPDRILFGGGVMKTPGLIDRLRTETRHLLAGYVGSGPASADLETYIQRPGLGDDAGITGALALAQSVL